MQLTYILEYFLTYLSTYLYVISLCLKYGTL